MALPGPYTLAHPSQIGGTGALDALHIERYLGVVRGTAEYTSILSPWVTWRPVTGTSILSTRGVGKSVIQKVTPGTVPDGTNNKVGKHVLRVDTLVASRRYIAKLEEVQADWNAAEAFAKEDGKVFGKFTDQALFIQGIKAALSANTVYSGLDAASGHYGGTTKTFTNAGDATDAVKFYNKLVELLAEMEENKGVSPTTDGALIVLRPKEFYLLSTAELLINSNYKTSNGTSVEGGIVLKAYGIPIVRSDNFPGGSNITGHLLSNANNGNAYDGDFTKVKALLLSPDALLAGESIPLTPQAEWDAQAIQWLYGSYTSFGVTVDQASKAGAILIP